MDPNAITPDIWANIGGVLSTLWLVVLSIVLFATCMLLGHNLLPSFIASGHVPEKYQRTRVGFYALAIIFFIAALVFLGMVVGEANTTIRMFFERFWI
ncbi:MAG: hypothetical protein L0177_06805 [Chloroflexi bacterium]|nr:hypothetical protein [Chloroflexota bacterium]